MVVPLESDVTVKVQDCGGIPGAASQRARLESAEVVGEAGDEFFPRCRSVTGTKGLVWPLNGQWMPPGDPGRHRRNKRHCTYAQQSADSTGKHAP